MHQQLNPTKPIFSIGDLADELNVHERTLRIYDSKGILSPVRTEKNRRKYSLNDLNRCKLILFLTRNLALNLMGVKIILKIIEKFNLKFESIYEIAKSSGIDDNIQHQNILKTSKRGRKPSQ